MYTIKGQDEKEYGPVDAAQVRQWLTQGRVDGRTLVRLEGATEWRPLGTVPELAASVPPPPLTPASTPPPDNAISTIIPYRNVPALIAYYLGVFSLIPCIGFVLGIGAFILGIMGLRHLQQHPAAKGKVHAWIGIILGTLVVIGHVVFIFIFIRLAKHR